MHTKSKHRRVTWTNTSSKAQPSSWIGTNGTNCTHGPQTLGKHNGQKTRTIFERSRPFMIQNPYGSLQNQPFLRLDFEKQSALRATHKMACHHWTKASNDYCFFFLFFHPAMTAAYPTMFYQNTYAKSKIFHESFSLQKNTVLRACHRGWLSGAQPSSWIGTNGSNSDASLASWVTPGPGRSSSDQNASKRS